MVVHGKQKGKCSPERPYVCALATCCSRLPSGTCCFLLVLFLPPLFLRRVEESDSPTVALMLEHTVPLMLPPSVPLRLAALGAAMPRLCSGCKNLQFNPKRHQPLDFQCLQTMMLLSGSLVCSKS